MVRCGPVETGALCDQNLLLEQQVENEFLVIDDVVDLRIEPREDVQRAPGLDAGDTWNCIQLLPGEVALFE